ncbi:MAG: hypothetical protein OEW39_06650 [Deltaproteobacteria bacterium]|nr:hypothetical protein [Deltaproteobacteria bacterium]
MSLSRLLNKWSAVRDNARTVLAMNRRNLNYIYPNNHRRDFQIADDKLITKEIMQRVGVPVPQTFLTYRYFFDLRDLERDLGSLSEFVIKPAHGSQGNGIVVIDHNKDGIWYSIGGTAYTGQMLRKHLSDIIFGIYSFDLTDQVLIEERVHQHSEMNAISPFGLADFRVILHQDRPVMAMCRVPTRASQGRANLHQGAVGVGLDLATGRTRHANHITGPVTRHPDTGMALLDIPIPFWKEILEISILAAKAVPLKYLGVDISVSKTGPMLLEINVRPGLAIQMANFKGLRTLLEA